MPTVNLKNVDLYYESHGEGEPLVLIPGFSNGLWIWFKQIPFFAERFQTIVYDPRGVSRSSKPQESMSMRDLAGDVAGLLKALNIERAHILGASFGGFVAQEFALSYPAMTRTLILSCTSFGGPGHLSPSADTLETIASTKGLNSEDRVRANLLLAFSPEYLREQPAEVEKIVSLRASNDVPEYAYLQQLHAAIVFNTEDRLPGIIAPTLVVTGNRDVIVPYENSLNLASKIPSAELQIVDGGSHTFFIERAPEFNELVEGFINRSGGIPE